MSMDESIRLCCIVDLENLKIWEVCWEGAGRVGNDGDGCYRHISDYVYILLLP